jgi:hypothetical protein
MEEAPENGIITFCKSQWNEWMNEWNEWMEWKNEWMNEWTNEWMNDKLFTFAVFRRYIQWHLPDDFKIKEMQIIQF